MFEHSLIKGPALFPFSSFQKRFRQFQPGGKIVGIKLGGFAQCRHHVGLVSQLRLCCCQIVVPSKRSGCRNRGALIAGCSMGIELMSVQDHSQPSVGFRVPRFFPQLSIGCLDPFANGGFKIFELCLGKLWDVGQGRLGAAEQRCGQRQPEDSTDRSAGRRACAATAHGDPFRHGLPLRNLHGV